MLTWRTRLGVAILLVFAAAVAVTLSVEAQRRVAEIAIDIRAMEVGPSDAKDAKSATSEKATLSTASRMDFWQKSIEFIRAAPWVGHGAGSTKLLFASLEMDRPSPYGEAVPDPHNQFLAIAIQAGLIGGTLLIAMWIAHLKLFFGDTVPHLLGQAVILQNVLSSLFNSSLSQVTQGTLYCLAVGLLGALIRQQKEAFGDSEKETPRPENPPP
jgi:O-antigen ligase